MTIALATATYKNLSDFHCDSVFDRLTGRDENEQVGENRLFIFLLKNQSFTVVKARCAMIVHSLCSYLIQKFRVKEAQAL